MLDSACEGPIECVISGKRHRGEGHFQECFPVSVYLCDFRCQRARFVDRGLPSTTRMSNDSFKCLVGVSCNGHAARHSFQVRTGWISLWMAAHEEINFRLHKGNQLRSEVENPAHGNHPT